MFDLPLMTSRLPFPFTCTIVSDTTALAMVLICCSLLQVRSMLSRVENVDAIIQAVPYLTDPKELGMALANLAAWFPGQVSRHYP